ncbi:MAG: dephospho-CoA kinase [Pseudobdellovibrionaceae bacterium]
MKWIGLTGSIGCGKSTVSQLLKEKSIPVVDADEIAKKVVEAGSPGLKAVVNEFGSDLLTAEFTLDRRKLGQVIFGDTEKKMRLEAILHPLIREETLRQRNALTARHALFAIYDIPLLFETKAEDQFDAIVVVSCTEEQQKSRLRVRNPQWTEHEIDQRIAAQVSVKVKEQYADFVVHNDGDLEHLKHEVDSLCSWLNNFSKD